MSSALLESRFFRIIVFTVVQALLSTLIALLAGLPAAFFTARRKFFFRDFLLSLSSIPFCIPSLLVALGYVSFFGNAGALNRLIMHITGAAEPPVTFLYSLAGIVICQGFYNFPLIMSTVSGSWERLSSTEADAARLLGASSIKVFRTITFWQLLPSMVSACIPVFLYCFFSFMIVLLFGSVGTTTLEVEIWQLAKVNLDFSGALKLGAAETALALFFVFNYTAIEQRASSLRGISFKSAQKLRCRINKKEKLPAALFFSAVFIFFLCPLFSIIVKGFSSRQSLSSFTFSNFLHLFSNTGFLKAVHWTLITAFFTGILCTVTAFFYALLLRFFDPKEKHFVFRVIPIIPLALSSVVVGVIITMTVRRGTLVTLIIAQTFLYWPVAFRQIYSDLQKIPQSTIEAARILSRTPLDLISKIYFPVLKKALLRSAGFCFAISAGDSTLPLVLAIPHFDTLSLYTYRLAGTYKFNEACASGVVLGLLCGLIYWGAKKLKAK